MLKPRFAELVVTRPLRDLSVAADFAARLFAEPIEVPDGYPTSSRRPGPDSAAGPPTPASPLRRS